VSEAALLHAAERLRPAIEQSGATFFEATTAIAFLAFAEAGVEVAVVEVGLGGRLDATNVLMPRVTGVTNVAIDHTEYLGQELRGIAVEKAGIIKEGVPILVGVPQGPLARVFQARAHENGAPYHLLDDMMEIHDVHVDSGSGTSFVLDSEAWGRQRLSTRLLGAHQARNASFAAELLGLLPGELRPSWSAIERGFRYVRWPGRLHVANVRGTTWILDVAHNPEGARTLASALDAMDLPEPRVLVAGILADKDWRGMLGYLVPGAVATILTCPRSAPTSRLWDPLSAAAWCKESIGITARVIPELGAALGRASTLAPHGSIVVTGSIHTVGDAMRELDIRVE
jgi:dihydrofolate synthase/folylpolyglutamate synthase